MICCIYIARAVHTYTVQLSVYERYLDTPYVLLHVLTYARYTCSITEYRGPLVLKKQQFFTDINR